MFKKFTLTDKILFVASFLSLIFSEILYFQGQKEDGTVTTYQYSSDYLDITMDDGPQGFDDKQGASCCSNGASPCFMLLAPRAKCARAPLSPRLGASSCPLLAQMASGSTSMAQRMSALTSGAMNQCRKRLLSTTDLIETMANLRIMAYPAIFGCTPSSE